MENKKAMIQREGAAKAYEDLFEIKRQALETLELTDVGQYLWMQGQLTDMDVGNVLRLKAQLTGARDVRTFEEWAEVGIAIKKGERALKILDTKRDVNDEVVLYIKKVFDISQTTRSYEWDPVCDNPMTHVYALVRLAGVKLGKFKKITPTTKNVAYLKEENIFVINPIVDEALLMVHAAENAIYRLREQNKLHYYLDGKRDTRIKSAHLAAQIYVSRYGISDPDGWEESLETLKALDLKDKEEMLSQARFDFLYLVSHTEPLFLELGKSYSLKDSQQRGSVR